MAFNSKEESSIFESALVARMGVKELPLYEPLARPVSPTSSPPPLVVGSPISAAAALSTPSPMPLAAVPALPMHDDAAVLAAVEHDALTSSHESLPADPAPSAFVTPNVAEATAPTPVRAFSDRESPKDEPTLVPMSPTVPVQLDEPHPEENQSVIEEDPTPERKHEDEDTSHPKWHPHRKHVFIVSDAGKPIYSRYGDELRLAPFFASLSAMWSYVEDMGDTLRYFTAGDRHFVFYRRGPIIYVTISCTGEPVHQLVRLLKYVNYQIVAILTFTGINKLFTKRPDCDLRRLLTDRHRHLDRLVHELNINPSLMLHAVHPLRLPAHLRTAISQALLAARDPELYIAFLSRGFQVIHYASPKKLRLDPTDFHVTINYVNSNSFKASEVWFPLCLPKYNDGGCLYAYAKYVLADVCLVMLSANAGAFYKLHDCANKFITSMGKHMQQLQEWCETPLRTSEARVPNLLHFMCLSRPLGQIALPVQLEPPYNEHKEEKRLYRVYMSIRDKIGGEQHKLYSVTTQSETVIAYFPGNDRELYATYGPLESKADASKDSNLLLDWITRNEADLFIQEKTSW
eukprot:TRINITY_DN3476_c0_g1_i1.p1 TRINITY_DN3476_c0_g1~~TRINITY_DN3476_c0_g1_i1.p1  ORF type:complete len:661 (+),score=157.78 TRINITY_DN3476_c0_g1_i1:264-1985(+)